MDTTAITEELELIAEAGDTSDLKDLARRLIRDPHWKDAAIDAHRCITAGHMDRTAVHALRIKLLDQQQRAAASARRTIREIARHAPQALRWSSRLTY